MLKAVKRRHLDYLKLHVNKDNVDDLHHDNETTLLCRAAQCGFVDICQFLLTCGANPLKGDCYGATPLHHASIYSNFECISLLIQSHKDAVYCTTNLYESTPLHHACFNACEHSYIVCRMLLEAGADVNAICSSHYRHNTPLRSLFEGDHFEEDTGKRDAAELLIDWGAKVEFVLNVKIPHWASERVARREAYRNYAAGWILVARSSRLNIRRIIGKDMIRLVVDEIWVQRFSK